MASDDDKGKQNPWETKPQGGKPSSGPPPLDQFFKNLFKKLGQKNNKNNKKTGNSGNTGNKNKSDGEIVDLFSFKLLGLLVLVLIIIWVGSGFYIVKPAEQSVVLRFGQYLDTVNPGPHWMPRFVDTSQIVNIDKVSMVTQSGLMLTSEENLVQVSFVVKYRISDPEAYLFNVDDPVGSLEQITDSAVRGVVGHSELSNILTDGRSKIRDQVEQQIKTLVAKYNLGLSVTDVDMQYASAPEQVKDAFDDVIKAREDQVTYINNGNTYANQVVPQAKGQAARIAQQADADQKRFVLAAQGEVANFNALLPQYKSSPEVTRERMYMDAMQQVLLGSRLMVIDSGDKGGMFYIPLPSDQSAQNGQSNVANNASSGANVSSANTGAPMMALQAASDNTSASSSSDASRNAYVRWQEAQNNAS